MAEETNTTDSRPGLPPPIPGFTAPQPIQQRPGQVTTGWQMLLGAAWTASFFAFAAVWKTSQDIGIGTWWLGARAQPQSVMIKIIPFVLIIVVGLAAIYNLRRVALVSLAGSVGVALIAVFDISRSGGLAAIEFAIAASLATVSVGALTGTYRAATTV
ncbi:hypothetical protein [uncultured Ilumatobacter sp.]|uniref:hypothetical protein n=1 Tax=uncultured Ilumatobacter sp. TaxID=879968 RepID=UPI00374EAE5F